MKYLPNALTLLRISLVPVFWFFMFWAESNFKNSVIALATFVIASISDYYDGMLARKYNVISNFGKIMDPLADKILVLTALFALGTEPLSMINIYMIWLIAFREVVITVLREIYKKKNIIIAANKSGKLKTVLQMTGIIAALLWFTLVKSGIIPEKAVSVADLIFNIYFVFVTVITVWSGLTYVLAVKKK
ncbi:MAG: CDP-diacylglycerol--glycerol-3-phosphate 3-phosphatidyltransferase [Candidatus Cloacimonadota bacterium]|nr:MAG: CDP-diacylglycerol--glycerol-3-phosphate 3-phosphatidyltransferase [Candidatus Cloacimonadota bacterium]